MALRIRPMQPDDVDDVFNIEMAAHRAPWSRDILRDCVLVNYDCRILEVYNDIGCILASYIICRYDENRCHVLNLCVAPSMQGNGYGQLLLQNVIESQQVTAVHTIILEVRPSNLAAMRLYQKMGFLQTGIKAGYYRDDLGVEDAVVLQKKLRSPFKS